MTVTHGVGPKGVAVPGSSKVQVIIIGLGIAGPVAAIECYYKGHVVVSLERSPRVTVLAKLCDVSLNGQGCLLAGAGHSIALGSNATKVVQVLRQLVYESDDVAAMETLDLVGRLYA
ncbi:hypothetical protein N7453_000161 [Penicillium expansum]|nr:hypothetical protein N7453_000161 [Penicillium expansum]